MCVHICVHLHVCVHVCECTQICVDGYMGYVCAHMYTHALRVVKYTCIVVGVKSVSALLLPSDCLQQKNI